METVVHVTTLEQWKSVLDVWFEQGYEWASRPKTKKYFLNSFNFLNARYLYLDSYIKCSSILPDNFIEYADFMAQQEKKMTTYEVTQEQFDLIEELTAKSSPVDALLTGTFGGWGKLDKMNQSLQRPILRYIGGDETIEFKVKEQLYRLWRVDTDGDRVYMKFSYGTPAYIPNKEFAFTAPLEEIKKWKTPAWEIEKAD